MICANLSGYGKNALKEFPMKRGFNSHEEVKTGVKGAGIPSSPGRESSRDLNYFREARLFLGKNRATLTFYAGSEVASIHYDMLRDEIFYKGHNVKNMTLTDGQWVSLEKFGDYLSQDAHSHELMQAYQNCLEQLLLRRMKNS